MELFKDFFEKIFSGKKPVIKNNTFLVWEPCSFSHSEVVPGYAKYLLDMGYHVSILVEPDRLKEGLFSNFEHENLSFNKMNRKQIKKYFKKSNLSEVEGLLVTTAGKICDSIDYEQCYNIFKEDVDKSKLFLVEHEIVHSADAGTFKNDIIALREMNYKGIAPTVINPHYFGDFEVLKEKAKNKVTNFVSVGAIRYERQNANLTIDAVKKLHEKGITNFKVTVIGKGHLKHMPKELRKYFDVKGRLPFNKMYEELKKADFFITTYDKNNEKHQRYNTTGTSGAFQLVYGFNIPCIIVEEFAKINGFDNKNAIFYQDNDDFVNALEKAIALPKEQYTSMKKDLEIYSKELYKVSLENFKNLVAQRESDKKC